MFKNLNNLSFPWSQLVQIINSPLYNNVIGYNIYEMILIFYTQLLYKDKLLKQFFLPAKLFKKQSTVKSALVLWYAISVVLESNDLLFSCNDNCIASFSSCSSGPWISAQIKDFVTVMSLLWILLKISVLEIS